MNLHVTRKRAAKENFANFRLRHSRKPLCCFNACFCLKCTRERYYEFLNCLKEKSVGCNRITQVAVCVKNVCYGEKQNARCSLYLFIIS